MEHKRASSVWANLRKEAPGYEVNETLWQAVDSLVLTKKSVRDCYQELADGLPLTGQYGDRLKTAMNIWADLYYPDSEGEGSRVFAGLEAGEN